MNQDQHLVFGAGLIGGYLAGNLLGAGLNVSLVAREKIKLAFANGLQVSDLLGNEQSVGTPSFIDPNAKQTHRFNYCWLTVKCTSVTIAAEELKKIIDHNTIIICCQNGLNSDLIVKQSFPNNSVLRAIIGFNVAELKPNQLHRSTDGKLVIESHNKLIELAENLNSALLPVKLSEDILAEQWAKLQLNLANPVNALADIPVKAMTENAGYRRILVALMLELLAVCDAMGLELPKVSAVPAHWIPRLMKCPSWLFKLLAKKMLAIDPTARLSMWWDLSTDRQTEIDFINGAVVRKGDELGVNCPVNRKIIHLVKQVESGDEKIGFSADQLCVLFLQK